jgi:hypothetical protein
MSSLGVALLLEQLISACIHTYTAYIRRAPHVSCIQRMHAITLRAMPAIISGCASWKFRQTLLRELVKRQLPSINEHGGAHVDSRIRALSHLST